jgi:hypothetical protein
MYASIDGIDQRNDILDIQQTGKYIKKLRFLQEYYKITWQTVYLFLDQQYNYLNIDQLVDLCEFFENTTIKP